MAISLSRSDFTTKLSWISGGPRTGNWIQQLIRSSRHINAGRHFHRVFVHDVIRLDPIEEVRQASLLLEISACGPTGRTLGTCEPHDRTSIQEA